MKTHKMITNQFLRSCYASELNDLRIGLRGARPEMKANVRFGLESGFWAVQKGLNRPGTTKESSDAQIFNLKTPR